MTLKLEKMTPKVFLELKNILVQEFENGNMPNEIQSVEQIESIIDFLQALKKKDRTIFRILIELGILKGEFSLLEKTIYSIVQSEQIDKIVNPNKKNKKNWMTIKLSTYLSYAFPKTKGKIGHIVVKKVYNKFKSVLISKINRVKTSPKVLELAQKHPDIDIKRLVSLGVVNGKLELVDDDLLWLDRMISIVICSKQNIKEEI